MCNPRRVTITATRELDEAWQREVTRTSRLSAQVVGEARVRQSLAATLGGPALTALERTLAEGDPEWQETEDGGYRHEVEGGYVVYDPDERQLEIVATREDTVEASGEATELLEGHLQTTVSVEGEGRYYDDEWGGHTRERAEKEAERRAEASVAEARQREVEEAQRQAEDARASDVEAQAKDAARESWRGPLSRDGASLPSRPRNAWRTWGCVAARRFIACSDAPTATRFWPTPGVRGRRS